MAWYNNISDLGNAIGEVATALIPGNAYNFSTGKAIHMGENPFSGMLPNKPGGPPQATRTASLSRSYGYGSPVGVTYGQRVVDGTVIWYNPHLPEEKADGSGYLYYADIAVALCDGQINALVDIYDSADLTLTSDNPGGSTDPADHPATLTAGPYTVLTPYNYIPSTSGSFWYYNGNSSQSIDSFMAAGSATDTTPAYRGTAYVIFEKYLLGDTATVPKLKFKISKYPATIPGLTSGDQTITNNGVVDANPACILYDFIAVQGAALNVSGAVLLDSVSFASAAHLLKTEGLGMSIIIDTQEDGLKWIAEILRHIDGILDLNETTGLFELKLLRASLYADAYASDYVLADQTLVDESDIKDLSYSRGEDIDNVNHFELTYANAAQNGKTASLTYVDTASIQRIGCVNKQTFDFPGLTNNATAWQAFSRVMFKAGKQLSAGSMTLDATFAKDIKNGDVLRLNYSPLNFSNLAIRVLSRTRGPLTARTINFSWVEDVFARATVSGVSQAPLTQPGSAAVPPKINTTFAAGTGVTATRDPLTNTITYGLTPPAVYATTTVALLPNTGHHFTAATLTTATLPLSASCVAGVTWIDIVVAGAGALKVAQNASQQIVDAYGNGSTAGVTGNLTTLSTYFVCRLIYIGGDKFLITNPQGSYDWNQ